MNDFFYWDEIKFDNQYLLETTQELIRIKAVNKPPKVTDYTQIIEYLKNEMQSLGFEIKIAGKENFPNIIGRLRTNGQSQRSLMLNAHMDTVPAGEESKWSYDPFAAQLKNSYVYGRGACDMRGQIAMLLTVVKAIRDNNLHLDGELALSFVSGHETGSINGSVYLVQNNPELLRADLCFIPEPTNYNISVASRGIYWVKAKTSGLNGHTATYNGVREDGSKIRPINAIHKMNKFINHLLDVDSWMDYEPNPFTGRENGMYSDKPIVEVNLISGGEKQNTVPGQCTATIDIRFLPSQRPEGIKAELHKLSEKIQKHDPEFEIEFEEDMIQYPPMDVDRNGQLYALAERNFNKVFGSELKPCGVCAPGDAVALGRIMPVAWLGPTWDNAHGFDEKVSIKELQDMARLYLALTLDYLNA